MKKQFEQLHPLVQEAVQYLKKHFENIVLKDLSNVLYSKNIAENNVYVRFISKSPFGEYKTKIISPYTITYNYLYFQYQLEIDFNQIYSDAMAFLDSKNYFIKIPNKLQQYKPNHHNLYIADNS